MASSIPSVRRESGRSPLLTSLLVAVVATTALATSACKTAPKVAYKQIKQNTDLDGKEFDKFVFQESVLVIDGKRDDKGNLLSPLQFTVTSVPAEHDDYTVAMYRRGSFGVKTNVVIAKIDNTEIPKEIGSEVVDTRIDMIKQIGGALVTLAAFSTSSGKTVELPRRIQISDLLKGNEAVDVVETGDGIKIDIGALHKDARRIDGGGLFDQTTSNFYYAACRTATVRMPSMCLAASNTAAKAGKSSKDGKASASATVCTQDEYKLQPVAIADPRYYQSVGLPQKGKINMHSQCGVSVSTDKDSGVSSNAAITAELLAQLAAVKEAIDKKDEGDGSK